MLLRGLSEKALISRFVERKSRKQDCSHGRPQRGAKRAIAPLESGTKKQKFLENVKSAV